MKSKVIHMYDYRLADIPEELRRWRIGDEEIEAQLKVIAHKHAELLYPETVAPLDSVACSGESNIPRWNRKALRFYPGRRLCDAALEEALLGARVGESRTVTLPEGTVTLTVTRIVRRRDLPVNDALVKLEKLEGVETVEAYFRWYRAQKEPERQESGAAKIALKLMRECVEHAEVSLDTQEQDAWLTKYVDNLYGMMLAAGMDPTVPEEGTVFLTEEEAKAKMRTTYAPVFREYVAQWELARQLSSKDAETFYEEGLQLFAERVGAPVETLQSGDRSTNEMQIATMKLLDFFSAYARQFLEE